MTMRRHPPVVSIVGRSGSGKTTLLEKLIPELKRRGYRVGTIKHHTHEGFEIDYPGKDTWRHARAGSDHVVITSPKKVATIKRVEREPKLDEVVIDMMDVDIILTEGYYKENKPKIEVIRAEQGKVPISELVNLLAIVADIQLDIGVPSFDFEEIESIVNLIERELMP